MTRHETARAVSWGAIYVLAAFVVVVLLGFGAAIYQQSRTNGDIAEQIRSCTDPKGECYQDAARTRLSFADLLNNERHQDLAAALVCFRDHPKASQRALVSCIEHYEAVRLHR